MSKLIYTLLLMFLVAGCETPKFGGAVKTNLTNNDPNAIIVVRTIPEGVSNLGISLKHYDINDQKWLDKQGSFLNSYLKDQGFIFVNAVPGQLVVESAELQPNWHICFHSNTLAFNVTPGKVHYLGTIKEQNYVEAIMDQAVQAGETKIRSSENKYYIQDELAPYFKPPAEDDLKLLNDYMRINLPEVSAEIVVPELIKTTYPKPGKPRFASIRCTSNENDRM
ncbi:MAG: hypothetical protein AAF603_06170 [Pseudomonadota bacterium]